MAEYRYPNTPVDLPSFIEEIKSALDHVVKGSLGMDGADFVVTTEEPLSQADHDTLDATVAAHNPNSLLIQKVKKGEEIDHNTAVIILKGFTYQGKVFSLSEVAQIKLIGTYAVRNHPAFPYPVKWNTKNNYSTVSLADATALENFFLLAMQAVRVAVDSGTALKDQVRAATTQAELDAVVDNR